MSHATSASMRGAATPGGGAGMRRAIVACAVGQVFELYDFAIYGFLAAAIARNFFPSSDPLNSLLSTFATFGVGFLTRPLGALVIGHFGDRHGRKRALVLTIGIMAAATGCTGLIPGYATLGLWAPVLLLACRLLQGFSTGGEWGGAATFIIEYAPPGRRGFFGSLQQVSTGVAQLTAISTAFALNSILDQPALDGWGWRVPFLVGFLLAPVGYYLRSRVSETPEFERNAAAKRVAAAPLRDALTIHRMAVLTCFGLTIIWTVATFVFLTFMPTFAVQTLKIAPSTALGSTTIAALINVTCLPFAGMLSDRIGRKPMMMASALGFLVLAYPLFFLVTSRPGFATLLLAQAVAAFLYSMFNGVASAALCELFPTSVRYTALSVGYNGAVMIFGGFAPFIATFLIRLTGDPIAPTYYVMACALVSLIVIARMTDRTHAALR
jgi:MFS transporter, MHS family, proline/betaine transporter